MFLLSHASFQVFVMFLSISSAGIAAGEPKRVTSKNYLKSFHVKGWPETVPFKTPPARMGANHLKTVMEQQEVIRSVITSLQPS